MAHEDTCRAFHLKKEKELYEGLSVLDLQNIWLTCMKQQMTS